MEHIFHSIKLSKDSKNPLYTQLYEKIKEMIVHGVLAAGTRLPSVRQLAGSLGINQITVVSAYRMLENNKYAFSKPGSGTYVAKMLPLIRPRTPENESMLTDELYHQDDISLIHNGQIKINKDTVNFASATPNPDLFPVEDFKQALNEVLDRDKGNAFGYQESQGFYPLRESIAKILHQSKIPCSADMLQIISGAQQGIDIISKAFLNQGDYVIVESPTYTGAIAVFKSRGAQIIDIELETDGPNLKILEYNLNKYRPRLIYTIPTFQNPTGYSYSNFKRQELLRLAEKYNAYIIEDDYVSDLDFELKGFIPIKALDKNHRVIFIKSFSKIFMPGLRLGFMIVPSELLGNILEAKHTTDISTSGLIQRTFDLYIRNGFWDKHYRFMYQIYKERYLAIVKQLDENLPDSIQFMHPGGGLNIWLDLPYGFSISELVKQCAAHNIVFAPGKIFYCSSSSQKLNHIRLSFAAVYTEQIHEGLQKLAEIISGILNKQNQYRNMPVL
ncbi:MAG: PLP-dependent aminotransferase family protein [Clostridia bacterium]|nr:PLP-dependent aminotransferase family protein [Clostridia bacterium]